jgi:hypothetical protein
MKRALLSLSLLCLAACSGSSPLGAYADYRDCAGAEGKLGAVFPEAKVLSCDADALVFSVQSMWATAEYRIADWRNGQLYTVDVLETGTVCAADGIDCEAVTREECLKNQDCTPSTLVQLNRAVPAGEGGTVMLAQWTRLAGGTVTMEAEDWNATLASLKQTEGDKGCLVAFRIDGVRQAVAAGKCR